MARTGIQELVATPTAVFNQRRLRLIGCFAFFAAATTRTLHGQTETAERVVIEADRLPDPESSAPFDVHTIDQDELQRAPELRLDDILRAEIPGFSLFRRNSSRIANPTTQGVTLRNFGPSGAGRTLVLLNGIPLNDPFAGYVLWSEIPPSSIESAVIVSGGGAGLFGNEALAGTIFLVTPKTGTEENYVESAIGNYGTYEVSASGTRVAGPVAISVFAERFATSGYPVLRASQRGPVDNTASADSDVFDLRGEWQITKDTSVRVEVRQFDDQRGNGTIYTRNDTRGTDASAVVTTEFPEDSAELQLSVYGQHRRFQSTFSSINASRTIETPAQDQFDVPANAIGGSAVWSMAAGPGNRLTTGVDFRWVEGETNEAFRWNGTTFTGLRHAGGDQAFAGVFAEDAWNVTEQFIITGSLRFDHWNLFDGFRRESNRQTGVVSLEEEFPDRDGNEINGRIGARFAATQQIAIRGAFYSGFRVPTLNELYRPFRVGNDVTEANPDLKPERLLGGETGIEFQPAKSVTLAGTAFLNRLDNAVGNITIGTGPGTFNPGGFIPAGGVLRQRQNLDLVVAPGFELGARWQVVPSLALRASYLFTHPTVERASDPSLEGKLLAETAEHVVIGGVNWNPLKNLTASFQIRYNDRQFEDDQNSRELSPFITGDVALTYDFSSHLSAAIKVENLWNEEIQTGRSADGLISIGQPRLVTFQVRCRF
jgi:vitamin B12 transporter